MTPTSTCDFEPDPEGFDDFVDHESGRVAARIEAMMARTYPPGTRVGEFAIVKFLGRGSQGDVYLARERLYEGVRLVALKFPDSNALIEFSDGHRFKHDNVLQMYHIHQFEGHPYIVMEYADAGTLDCPIRSGQCRKHGRRFVGLLAEVAEALHQAHASGLIHRDVKPSNIFLVRKRPIWNGNGSPPEQSHGEFDDSVRLKVGDFGLVTRVGRERVVGTRRFIAPERFLHDHPRGDQFSLAVTAVCVLAGEAAELREEGSIFQLLGPDTSDAAASYCSPTPRALMDCGIDHDLAYALAKAMSRNPYDRYKDMGAFAADLAAWSKGRRVSAAPLYRRLRALYGSLPRGVQVWGWWVVSLVLLLIVGLLWELIRLSNKVEQLQQQLKG